LEHVLFEGIDRQLHRLDALGIFIREDRLLTDVVKMSAESKSKSFFSKNRNTPMDGIFYDGSRQRLILS
jgi:hypothetical protein